MNPLQAPGPQSPFDDGELYDALFGNFDYGLDFYLGLTKEAKGPVLDIACGTGRIMLPCLEAGVDIERLDLYDAMLDRLRSKRPRRTDSAVAERRGIPRCRRAGDGHVPFGSKFALDLQVRDGTAPATGRLQPLEICGDFDRRPLVHETDLMIVLARNTG